MLWYDTVRGGTKAFYALQNKSSTMAMELRVLKWQTSLRVRNSEGNYTVTFTRPTYDSYNIRASTGHFDIVTYRGNGEQMIARNFS